MFLVRRDLVSGKPFSSEDALKNASATKPCRNHNQRNARLTCNTSGGPLGARKSCAVVQARAAGDSRTHGPKSYGQLNSLVSTLEAAGGGSVASHEIQWSDTSEPEDTPCGFPDSPVSTSALPATPGGAELQCPNTQQQPHDHPPQGALRRRAEARSSARRRNAGGPAAALSGSVVAAVRRRVKQALPRAVAVAHAAPAAAPPSPPLLSPSPSPLLPLAAPTAASPASSSGGGGGHPTAGSQRTAVVTWLVLLTAAAAAAAAAAGLLVATSPYRYSLHGPDAAWRKHDLSDGNGGGNGVAAVHGGLPYMAGWASLLAAGRTSRRAPSSSPRGSVVVAAVASGAGSRRGALSSGSGGAGPRQWWFSRTGQSAATAGAPLVGGLGSAAPLQPSPLMAAAAAADVGGGAQQPPQPQDYEWRESAAVRVVTIVHGGGAASPYGTDWESLAAHTAQRLEWTDPSYQMLVFRAEQLGADAGLQAACLRALEGGAQMVVGLDVDDAAAETFLKDPRVASKLPGVALFVGGSETLSRALTQLQGGLRPLDTGSWRTALARRLTWTPDGRGLAVWDTLQLLLGRHDSDNFLFVYLVLVNQYVTTVPQVADTTKGFDLQSLICMVKHCGSKVVGCVRDATCKSALDCLQACTFNDQVCQYRCIVSHESPLLEQFSLCILQLHNCRNLDAKPPLLPDPAPMPTFRGAPLTHETAEELFFGWLDEPAQGAPRSAVLGDRPGRPYSWLVVAGKNPAYDYFPCQHQLYYRGRGRGQVWYEPVFKAITLDGREVWRRRVYRVRRGKVPGTFHLSVLDNGVTSNEFWRILDCEEDLSYCLFYYSGAASAAGLSYSGAVLGTPDGRMPAPQLTSRLHAALRRAGIEPWELSYVDNSKCAGAPLGITGPVAPPPASGAAAAIA